ncbi:MAG: hypothetical protein H6624_11540 [Bdellovibrionaceae bacterium]|nr:hypothetical protein [Bdellovibrionales bacterium]MCB9084972.1 hypothetical protein [Pseudobdellovibrionaceae bacterium]
MQIEDLKRYMTRLVEIHLHQNFQIPLNEDESQVHHRIREKKVRPQIEIQLPDGLTMKWNFPRWWPRCEIAYGASSTATDVFRYQAMELIPFVTGKTSTVNYQHIKVGEGDSQATTHSWHPMATLKGVWKKSVQNPMLSPMERDRVRYPL